MKKAAPKRLGEL